MDKDPISVEVVRGRAGKIREFILRSLADFERPGQIEEAVLEMFGRKLATGTVQHYRNSPKWLAQIEELRQQQPTGDLPMSSRRWRQQRRVDVFQRAMRNPDASGLAAARGVLADAARDVDQVDDGGRRVPAVVLQVMQLPAEALAQLAAAGTIHPSAYLADVKPPGLSPPVAQVDRSDVIGHESQPAQTTPSAPPRTDVDEPAAGSVASSAPAQLEPEPEAGSVETLDPFARTDGR